ncbi:MAG: bifunctional demethylmenaquinone methyltransferase/2-methoxy-6-polyprenyl-1,4-benzoquinol methylase [Flavobacteriaceae bacterium TMED179]|nr:MAG: bifunctional demethylmenaquinone methyltransferase/2-methoxy-6-polyprenyl-1,4-benzoquinol methylase [Flavobacteriaceae bacterium TMED179]|tara:strand:+ start:47228 stop:47959 length:732 start_codon:yes stop_codon:yes gene_type:complete
MKKYPKPNKKNSESKKNQVTQMFNSISQTYDTSNRLITFGLDLIWRKKVISIVKKQKHETILDIATGTGELVIALAKLKTKKIVGLDISQKMLNIGKQKVISKKLENRVEMRLGDSENLDYEDSCFDVVTVAFGVRNFENLEKGLQEIKRVLKPSGILLVLETAIPTNTFFKVLYNIYARKIIPFVGRWLSKNNYAYRYLYDSTIAFPNGKTFNNILRKNGFIDVEDFPQTFGVSSIYFAKKP